MTFTFSNATVCPRCPAFAEPTCPWPVRRAAGSMPARAPLSFAPNRATGPNPLRGSEDRCVSPRIKVVAETWGGSSLRLDVEGRCSGSGDDNGSPVRPAQRGKVTFASMMHGCALFVPLRRSRLLVMAEASLEGGPTPSVAARRDSCSPLPLAEPRRSDEGTCTVCRDPSLPMLPLLGRRVGPRPARLSAGFAGLRRPRGPGRSHSEREAKTADGRTLW